MWDRAGRFRAGDRADVRRVAAAAVAGFLACSLPEDARGTTGFGGGAGAEDRLVPTEISRQGAGAGGGERIGGVGEGGAEGVGGDAGERRTAARGGAREEAARGLDSARGAAGGTAGDSGFASHVDSGAVAGAYGRG